MADPTLLQAVSQSTSLEPAVVQQVLEAVGAVARQHLANGRAVQVPGLGVLSSGPHAQVRFDPDTSLTKGRDPSAPRWWEAPDHQRARRLARTLVSDLALYRSDLVPRLSATMGDPAVEAHCGQVFGHLWREARRTFTAAVSGEVQEQFDHLAEAARQRWAEEGASPAPA